jgi:hypothetical protein
MTTLTMTQALAKLAQGTTGDINKPVATASGEPTVAPSPGTSSNATTASGEPSVAPSPGASSNATTASGQPAVGTSPEGGEKGTSKEGDTQALTKNAEERNNIAFGVGFEWGMQKSAEEEAAVIFAQEEAEIADALEVLDGAGYDIEKMAGDMPAFMKKKDDDKDDKKKDDKDGKKDDDKKPPMSEKKDDKKPDEKK